MVPWQEEEGEEGQREDEWAWNGKEREEEGGRDQGKAEGGEMVPV